MWKVSIALLFLSQTRAGVINTHLVPAASSHSSSNNNIRYNIHPAPIYENVHENSIQYFHATPGNQLTNSIGPINGLSQLNTQQVNSVLTQHTQSFPTQNSVIHTSQNIAPLFNPVLTQTPLVAHTSSGGKAIASNLVSPSISSFTNVPIAQSHPLKTTITYSEAPSVSHMTFTGLGTSYSW